MTGGRRKSYFSFLFFFFWPRHAACGILASRPGIKPVPPALEAWSLNHWTAREVQEILLFIVHTFLFDYVYVCCPQNKSNINIYEYMCEYEQINYISSIKNYMQ